MAIAATQKQKLNLGNVSSGDHTCTAFTSTANSTLVVIGFIYGTSSWGATPISDSKGCTWSQVEDFAAGSEIARVWYTTDTDGSKRGTSHTVTITSGSNSGLYVTFFVIEVTGTPTSNAFDVSGDWNSDASSPFVSGTTGSTATGNLLAIAGTFSNAGGTESFNWSGNSYTSFGSPVTDGASYQCGDVAYKALTGSTTTYSSVTLGNGTAAKSVVAVFKEDAGGVTNTDYLPGAGAAALTGQLPLVNPQYSRPSADVSDGGWTPSTGTDLYAVLDEATRDDADYITSPTNPSGTASDTCTVKLATLTDPGVDTGFQVQWAATATGATGTVVGSLRQGNAPGTEIAAWTHASLTVGSYTQFGDEVTAAQAGNITDFSDLYFRIVAS